MQPRRDLNRAMLAAAGVCGAIGVATAAAASHGGKADLGIAANFLQLHAPVLIGIALLARNRVATAAGWVLIVGLALFCGDLAARSYLAASPLPLAAPIGGLALIVGWLLVALSAFVGWRDDPDARQTRR